MKASKIIAITTSLFSSAALAGSCDNHQMYCGHTLDNMGWSTREIIDACKAESHWNGDQYPNNEQVLDSLFKCGASGGKLVRMNDRKPCAHGCKDGGDGNPDFC